MRSVLFVLLTTLGLFAQTTDALKESCAEVQMSCSYNDRYALIDMIYQATGKALFDKASNPYTRDEKDTSALDNMKPPRFYIGTATQNQKLARNILANKSLFAHGKVSLKDAKKWHFVN